MNWGLIGWVAGVLLTLYMIKFVWMMIRSLFSKDTMSSVMEITGDKVNRLNRKMTKKIKQKAEQKKKEREARKKDEASVVAYIR